MAVQTLKRKKRLRAAAVMLAAVSSLVLLTSFMLPPRFSEELTIIAHRGASGYAPENTMAAFELADEMKADYIELDVQMSADGELVVIHDETLDRTTDGAGRVQDHLWSVLRTLDAGSKYAADYAGEPIPLLSEVLDRFGGRMGIVIELKSPSQYPEMVEQLAQMVESYWQTLSAEQRQAAPILLQSFDLGAVQQLAERIPDVPRAALIDAETPALVREQLAQVTAYADYVNLNYELLDQELVDDIHARGRKVMAWTLRDPQDMQRIVKLGVDGVITDYPVWGYER